MWALRHLGNQGLTAHALVAPHVRANFRGRMVRYWYYGLRNRENERALGTRAIEATALRALTRWRCARASRLLPRSTCRPTPGRRQRADRHPRAVRTRAARPVSLAAASDVPMFVFLTGIRMTDGKRTLRIHRLAAGGDIRQRMNQAYALLEQAIVEDPAAWHFWRVTPRFFCEAESAPAP